MTERSSDKPFSAPQAEDPATCRKTEDSSRKSEDSSRKSEDVVLVHGVTEDQKGLRVLRKRDERLEIGEVRPVVAGAPLYGDLVKLRPRKDAPFLCDVETQFSPDHLRRASASDSAPDSAQRRGTLHGPAQVATESYRENWDKIWN